MPTAPPTVAPTLSPTFSPTQVPTTSLPTASPTALNYDVTTIAGGNKLGTKDGDHCQSQVNYPNGIVAYGDSSLLIADSHNHAIRRFYITSAVLTTIAGCGAADFSDGVGTTACFHNPSDIAVDPANFFALITDSDNGAVRVLTLSSLTVTTIEAPFDFPNGVAMDPQGRYAYVTELYLHVVSRIDVRDWTVSIVAGSGNCGFKNGAGVEAAFCYPRGIAVSPSGNTAVVADFYNKVVRTIDLQTWAVGTLCDNDATNGPCNTAIFEKVVGIKHDGEHIYATSGNEVKRINIKTRNVVALGTRDGGMQDVRGVATSNGVIYVTTIDSIKAMEFDFGYDAKTTKGCKNSRSATGDNAGEYLKNNIHVTVILCVVVFIAIIVGVWLIMFRGKRQVSFSTIFK